MDLVRGEHQQRSLLLAIFDVDPAKLFLIEILL
jgi:hypothetical protein